MKIIISEAHVTKHFMERLSERIPVEVKRSDTLKSQVISNFELLQKLIFPIQYSFSITLLEISPLKILTAVVDNNKVVTFIISDHKRRENDFIISDLQRFAKQYSGFLKKSKHNPDEIFTSKFFNNGKLSYIMTAKAGRVIEITKNNE